MIHPDARDESFDISKHVLELPVGGPVDEAALRDVVAGLMRARLDRSRPLWTVHLVPELVDGGAALVLRIHHALADGGAAMRICSNVLWEETEAPASQSSRATARSPGRVPARPTEQRSSVVRELRPRSGYSPLDARISARRTVAFAGAALADIKTIAASAQDHATVNDVVLCCVAGALRRGLFAGVGAPRLRAKVPVSLHRPDEGDVANRDSFLCVDLDVAEEDPHRRLAAIRRDTQQRKLGGDANVLDELLHGGGGPRRLLAQVANRWSASARVFALNISNVRGPSGALSVAGRPVRDVYSLAEIGHRHALRVACVSVSGRLTFGLCADPAAVPAHFPVRRRRRGDE